jgi:valyl-tRNA synthetase
LNVPAKATLTLYIGQISEKSRMAIEDNTEILLRMARLEQIQFEESRGAAGLISFVSGDVTASLVLGDLIDINKEKERLNKELLKTQSDIKSMESRLANDNFIAKATDDVIDETKSRLEECQHMALRIEKIVQAL